ncbi:MAG: ABATE domain-containing protein, partial [Microbispora sp.]|nr:ABATE domain-containing protein [Microbispora sp.]
MTGPAELLRDFVNTYDVEEDTDELASPAELCVWLRERGLIGDDDRAADEDLAVAIQLREGLRAALRGNHDGGPYEAPEGLESVLAGLPVRVTLPAGTPALEPVASGVAGGRAPGGRRGRAPPPPPPPRP